MAGERELTEEQFAIVAHVASLPVPVPALVTDDDVRQIIGALAGTLKAPRTSLEQGRLKLGMYRKALAHLSREALAWASERAIRELEWMPTPAELLRLAEGFKEWDVRLHSRAVTLTAARRQRLFEERLRAVRERTMPAELLDTLSDHEAKVAETRGLILIRIDGRRQYRTPETIREHLSDVELRAQAAEVERTNRAPETGEGAGA